MLHKKNHIKLELEDFLPSEYHYVFRPNNSECFLGEKINQGTKMSLQLEFFFKPTIMEVNE